MKRELKGILAAVIILPILLKSSLPIYAKTAERKFVPTYKTVTEVFDWGPAVTKVIVNLGETVARGSVGTNTFKVYVKRTDPRPGVQITDASGYRTVTKAYASDGDGNAADYGKYVTIEMKIGPDVGLGYPIHYDAAISKNNGQVDCGYIITQQKEIPCDSGKISGTIIQKKSGDIKKLVDSFTTGSYSDGNGTLKYACFSPEKDQKKHPLIVWLHGAGEIGTDPTIPILANKSCRFASPEVQSYFGGTYVLSPQCSTMWMQGSIENTLMSLIRSYVSQNREIDSNRIYLGGNSNGGYMAMALAMDFTDYFAAVLPVCEAMPDRMIPDTSIQKMKDLPIWFTAAKTDQTVPPDSYTVPTYNRLKKAGAKEIHFSYFNNVVDTTGLYKKKDGTPYEYNGHFSYFYVFNNQCTDIIDGKKTTILQWLASQNKARPAAIQQKAVSVQNKQKPQEPERRPNPLVFPMAVISGVIIVGAFFGIGRFRRKYKQKNR